MRLKDGGLKRIRKKLNRMHLECANIVARSCQAMINARNIAVNYVQLKVDEVI